MARRSCPKISRAVNRRTTACTHVCGQAGEERNGLSASFFRPGHEPALLRCWPGIWSRTRRRCQELKQHLQIKADRLRVDLGRRREGHLLALALAVLSNASRSPLASFEASAFAQKCMKNSRGCSVNM